MTRKPNRHPKFGKNIRGLVAILGAVAALFCLRGGEGMADDGAQGPVKVSKVWDLAPHSGFTDLAQFGKEFFVAFREGTAHNSLDGRVRVLVSPDGQRWESAALLGVPGVDVRDPKFSLTPAGRLMLNAAASQRDVVPSQYQSIYWLSADGRNWLGPTPCGQLNDWLWRVAWSGSTAYSVGYRTLPPYQTTLYAGNPEAGLEFKPVLSPLVSGSYGNETALLFRRDAGLLALTRRDPIAPYTTTLALVGYAGKPYITWSWTETDHRLGGPDMLELRDGRVVVGARVYTPSTHTGLLWLDPQRGSLIEFLSLPSGGDTGYPGLIVHGDELWVSYYSSHEGKASIYLATGISLFPGRARAYFPVLFANR